MKEFLIYHAPENNNSEGGNVQANATESTPAQEGSLLYSKLGERRTDYTSAEWFRSRLWSAAQSGSDEMFVIDNRKPSTPEASPQTPSQNS